MIKLPPTQAELMLDRSPVFRAGSPLIRPNLEVLLNRALQATRDTLKESARALLAQMPDSVAASLRTVKKYRYTFGRWPNVLFPKTFNEKVQARKLFDRRPLLSTWVDKYAVRDHVLGKSALGRLPRLYHVTDHPDDIPFDSLPDRYVVKASHGSGWVHVVKDGSAVDRDELIATCKGWLALNYFNENLELVYRNVKPRILIEEFLDNGAGESAEDFKLYVFDGKVRFVQIDVARFGAHRRNIYDADWNLLPVRLTVETFDGVVERPPLLERMIRYAEALSEKIDFVRVDLYVSGGEVFFGEMTPSSGNGFNRFVPASYDEEFGRFWRVSRKREPAGSAL